MMAYRARADRRDRPLAALAWRAGEPLRDPALHLVAGEYVELGVGGVVPAERRLLAAVPVQRPRRPLAAPQVGAQQVARLTDRHGRTWRPAGDLLPRAPRVLVGLGLGVARGSTAAHALRGQDNRWGQKDHSPSRWCAILVEEVGKAAQQANKLEWCAADPAELRAKVISAAAVAVAWVEAIDRAAANSRDTGTAGGG